MTAAAKRTQRLCGVWLLSCEMDNIAEAETLVIRRRQHVRRRYARRCRSAGVEDHITSRKERVGTWEVSCLAGASVAAPVRIGKARSRSR